MSDISYQEETQLKKYIDKEVDSVGCWMLFLITVLLIFLVCLACVVLPRIVILEDSIEILFRAESKKAGQESCMTAEDDDALGGVSRKTQNPKKDSNVDEK